MAAGYITVVNVDAVNLVVVVVVVVVVERNCFHSCVFTLVSTTVKVDADVDVDRFYISRYSPHTSRLTALLSHVFLNV